MTLAQLSRIYLPSLSLMSFERRLVTIVDCLFNETRSCAPSFVLRFLSFVLLTRTADVIYVTSILLNLSCPSFSLSYHHLISLRDHHHCLHFFSYHCCTIYYRLSLSRRYPSIHLHFPYCHHHYHSLISPLVVHRLCSSLLRVPYIVVVRPATPSSLIPNHHLSCFTCALLLYAKFIVTLPCFEFFRFLYCVIQYYIRRSP